MHPSRFPCAAQHTDDLPYDLGYVEGSEAAEKRLRDGWTQSQCPTCERWAVWHRPEAEPTSKADAEHMVKLEAG